MSYNKSGQAVIIDFVIAIIIFLIAFIFIAGTYTQQASRLESETSDTSLMLKAFDITEMLTKSEGIPNNWNISNVQAIGLASGDRVLSTQKITQFSNLSYNVSKDLFGIVGKEFFIQIRDLTNANLFEAGVSPLEGNTCNNSYRAVTLRRFAFWGGQKVIIYFTLWDDDCTRNASGGRLIISGPQTYISSPFQAFEEDESPTWTTQIQARNDFFYANVVDEGLYKPDYIQFDFPHIGVPSNRAIKNATFKFWHWENLAGGSMPATDPSRSEIECWNGNWVSLGAYILNLDNTTFVETSSDISSCITSPELANNINIRVTFDPAFDAGGRQGIDYAEVAVNAA